MSPTNLWLFLITGSLALFADVFAANGNNSYVLAEKRLYRYLLKDQRYNKAIRPVYNITDAVGVIFSLSLMSMAELNEREQLLTINVWQSMRWTDEQLVWDKKDYDGIATIRIPTDELWVPDIVPYTAGHGGIDHIFHTPAIVSNTGMVMWEPNLRVSTICPIDLTYFPYDTQVCKIRFGPWSHDDNQINLSNSTYINTYVFTPHQEWKLLDATSEHKVVRYPCCPTQGFPEITYTFKLRRNSGYLTYVFAGPAVVLSLMTPIMFLLPPESGEKVTFGTGLMFLLVVILMILGTIMPSSHPTIPLIGYYYVVSMITTCVSLATSAAIVSVWYRSLAKRPMPGFLQTVVGALSRVLFVSQDDVAVADSTMRFRRLETAEGADSQAVGQEGGAAMVSEWRQLALILDRICFVVFFVVMVVISGLIASKP